MADRLIELLYENNVRCDIGIESLAEDIRSIFADVQPVIHAAWIDTTPDDFYEWYKCSNCKYTDTKEFNYCPKCGAKMDL